MELSEELRSYLVNEFHFAANRLRAIEDSDLFDATYFYSAVYGGLNRVMNINYSDELCLAHLVTFAAHQALGQRVNALLAGQERSIKLPKAALRWLADATDALAAEVEVGQISVNTLALTARVAHTLTGNGYYLAVSGRVPSDAPDELLVGPNEG